MHKFATKKFREYETIFILSPVINQSATDGITKKIQATLEQYEGKLTKVSLWGMRKLAYKISKREKGIFYQLNYVAPQGFVDEMEKKFKLDDMILRYLTVKTSDKEVNPEKIIVKSPDVEFESVEALSESPPTDESIEEVSEEAGEGPVEEPAAPKEEKKEEKAGEEPVKKPVEEPAKKPVEEPAKKPVEEPAKEAAAKPEKAEAGKPAAEKVAQPSETIIIDDDSFADIEVEADVKPPAAAEEDKQEKASEEKPEEPVKVEEDEKK